MVVALGLGLGLVVAMLMLAAPGSALLFAALAVVATVLWRHQVEDRLGS